ncbi:MAG: class I SAM-dependent methyltransferase [Pseudomonadales bacterium]
MMRWNSQSKLRFDQLVTTIVVTYPTQSGLLMQRLKKVILSVMSNSVENQSTSDTWRRYDAIEQRLSAPLTNRMLQLGELRPGLTVLDVATGRGEPAIPAAKKVLPGGRVLGVDIDPSVLQIAKEKREIENVTNLELVASDLEVLQGIPNHSFDVVLARWCLMYVKNPQTALKRLREVLTRDGKLVAAIWVNPEEASFYQLPRLALSSVTAATVDNYNVPSTFYYSNEDRLEKDLSASDFKIVHSESIEISVMELSSEEELISWGLSFGGRAMLQQLSKQKKTSGKKTFSC